MPFGTLSTQEELWNDETGTAQRRRHSCSYPQDAGSASRRISRAPDTSLPSGTVPARDSRGIGHEPTNRLGPPQERARGIGQQAGRGLRGCISNKACSPAERRRRDRCPTVAGCFSSQDRVGWRAGRVLAKTWEGRPGLASPDAPAEYKKRLIAMSTGGQVKYVEFVLLAMNYAASCSRNTIPAIPIHSRSATA